MLSKSNKDFIIELIRIIKPEFYNKLTWTTVVAGIALLSSPIWQDIAVAALKKYFELDVTLVSDPKWGFWLIISGLVYHFVTNSLLKFMNFIQGRDIEKSQKTHDIEIYKDSTQKLNEKKLFNFFNRLTAEHAFWFEESNFVEDLRLFLSEHDNEYLTKEIKYSAGLFIESLETLMVFVATHFVVYPKEQQGGNLRLCMYPDGNRDRALTVTQENSDIYDKLSAQLNDLVKKASEDYIAYRKSVKESLFV